MNSEQIRRWNRRARQRGLAGNLTPAEWERVVTFFQQRCAYCQKRPIETLDHFVPLAFGGGSTSTNSVPSCIFCNQAKADRHPDLLTAFYPKALAQVRAYLQEEGQRLQERAAAQIQRLPYMAHGLQAILHLKAYCEEQVQATDDTVAHYTLLLFRIFGVDWDPPNILQTRASLLWQIDHSFDAAYSKTCYHVMGLLDTYWRASAKATS